MKNRNEDRGARIEDRGSRIEDRVQIRTEEKGLGRAKRGAEDAGCKVHRAGGLTRSSILAPRSSRGFTLIELIVVISIVVILTGALLTRVWFYQEQAEKAAMEQVAGALQGAMVLQYAHLLTRGKEAEAKNLLTENPTRWLMRKPPNYAGEFDGITPDTIEPGNWAYDLKTCELIYVPYRNDYFVPGKDGLKWVRYRARLEHESMSGAASKGAEELTSVLFVPVESYQWFVKEGE